MRAEVGLARPLEYVGTAMGAYGLQGGARSRYVAAVVDQESPATVAHRPCADLGGERAALLAEFRFGTLGGLGQERGERRRSRRQREGQRFAVGCQAHHSLAPAARGLVELAHRQRVEEFVGDQQQWSRRYLVEAF